LRRSQGSQPEKGSASQCSSSRHSHMRRDNMIGKQHKAAESE
jgi:hypothetical protein